VEDDDQPIGRILTRREALVLLGSASLGAAFLAACDGDAPAAEETATPGMLPTAPTGSVGSPSPTASTAVAVPSCIVRPALTEGPFFVDDRLNRSDIRTDPSDNSMVEGVPLVVTFRVASIASNACNALAGAMVDIWQCDAIGRYSDVQDRGADLRGKKFLRGYQVTDASGKAEFTTIYPGWYQGRATHIHFKIRTTTGGRTADFTSQFFFEEAVNDEVYAKPPYNKPGSRTRNANDGIFQQSAGKLLLPVAKTATGYATTFDVGLQAT
jgi:protocatechuate 3,4-dioxygenase beta subunit